MNEPVPAPQRTRALILAPTRELAVQIQEDAKALSIADGDQVTVKASTGELRLKAKVGTRLPQGVVFAPYHFGEQSLNTIATGSAVTWVSISK